MYKGYETYTTVVPKPKSNKSNNNSKQVVAVSLQISKMLQN